MEYTNNVNTKVISLILWGSKKDPTEYDYPTQTIRIREDYFKQMGRKDPLSHHWMFHEFAHYLLVEKYGKDYITSTTGMYPDNRIERFAFAYQFYYLMETRTCNTLDDLFSKDPFFRHKKLYARTLEHYWNNANFIIQEFKNT